MKRKQRLEQEARDAFRAKWERPAPPPPRTQWVDIVEHGRAVGQVDLKSGMRLQSDMTAGELRNARRLEQRFGTR